MVKFEMGKVPPSRLSVCSISPVCYFLTAHKVERRLLQSGGNAGFALSSTFLSAMGGVGIIASLQF